MDAVETWSFLTGISSWSWLTGAALVALNCLVHRKHRKELALRLLVPVFILILFGLVLDFNRTFSSPGIPHAELPLWLDWFVDLSLVRLVVALVGAAPVIFFAYRTLPGGFWLRNAAGIVPLIIAIVDTLALLGTLAFMLLLNPFP